PCYQKKKKEWSKVFKVFKTPQSIVNKAITRERELGSRQSKRGPSTLDFAVEIGYCPCWPLFEEHIDGQCPDPSIDPHAADKKLLEYFIMTVFKSKLQFACAVEDKK
ncbi:hypothetical protein BGX27_008511, partial [Mortierella sp. AM989]